MSWKRHSSLIYSTQWLVHLHAKYIDNPTLLTLVTSLDHAELHTHNQHQKPNKIVKECNLALIRPIKSSDIMAKAISLFSLQQTMPSKYILYIWGINGVKKTS